MSRFCNADYDKLVRNSSTAAGVESACTIAKKLNEMLTRDSYAIVPRWLDRAVSRRMPTRSVVWF